MKPILALLLVTFAISADVSAQVTPQLVITNFWSPQTARDSSRLVDLGEPQVRARKINTGIDHFRHDTATFYTYMVKGDALTILILDGKKFMYRVDSTGWAKIYVVPNESNGDPFHWNAPEKIFTTTYKVLFFDGYSEKPGIAGKPQSAAH